MKIVTIDNKKDEGFLKTPTEEIDLKKEDKKELRKLIKNMRKKMIETDGVGLSANQVGINKKIFVAQIPDENGKPKFYAVINPKITKKYSETNIMNEGCLSVPGIYGPVERPNRVILEGENLEGKKIKIKAWGFLARVFQHEIDHLNGKLFTDKAKSTFKMGERDEEIREI